MLGTKSRTKPANNNSNGLSMDSKSATCVVAKGTSIEGKFNAVEDVRLDGTVKGDVKCDKRMVMGATGKIEGSLHAHDAIIMGTVEGELIVKDTLHLKNTAIIKGDIKAKSMKVDEGAKYNGQCQVGAMAAGK